MDKIQIIFNRLVNKEYSRLTMKQKKELYNESGFVDCGTDYARYILDEVVFDKNGASIY